MTICPHVPNTERYAVLDVPPPRGAVRVHCPCCNLPGWFDDDDPAPMTCPYCEVEAVAS